MFETAATRVRHIVFTFEILTYTILLVAIISALRLFTPPSVDNSIRLLNPNGTSMELLDIKRASDDSVHTLSIKPFTLIDANGGLKYISSLIHEDTRDGVSLLASHYLLLIFASICYRYREQESSNDTGYYLLFLVCTALAGVGAGGLVIFHVRQDSEWHALFTCLLLLSTAVIYLLLDWEDGFVRDEVNKERVKAGGPPIDKYHKWWLYAPLLLLVLSAVLFGILSQVQSDSKKDSEIERLQWGAAIAEYIALISIGWIDCSLGRRIRSSALAKAAYDTALKREREI